MATNEIFEVYEDVGGCWFKVVDSQGNYLITPDLKIAATLLNKNTKNSCTLYKKEVEKLCQS